MTDQSSSCAGPRSFPVTRWSVVLAATRRTSPDSARALETICRAYWYPLYAHARRCGQSPHDAEDLTQEFFCRLFQKRWLDAADREKGRLRTYLLVSFKYFMANEWRHAVTQRRGAGRVHVPIDTAFAESRYAADLSAKQGAEVWFDRQWALTLLDLAVGRLQMECEAAGNPGDFDVLKDCLLAERGSTDYAAVARRLGVNPGAARVAVHRLRKRFREIFREETAQTLSDGVDVDGELRHLAAALASEQEGCPRGENVS